MKNEDRILEVLVESLKVQEQHSQLFIEQGNMIREQGKALQEQSKQLQEQSKQLQEQGKMLRDQNKMLDDQGKKFDRLIHVMEHLADRVGDNIVATKQNTLDIGQRVAKEEFDQLKDRVSNLEKK